MKRLVLSIVSLFFMLLVPVLASAVNSDPEKIIMCDIIGTVEKTSLVEKFPWNDGTPSKLSTYETHISVLITDRKPHNDQTSAERSCQKDAKQEQRIYKLCSPTSPAVGDRIHGTEGVQTGSSAVIGCLFDLVILPKNK